MESQRISADEIKRKMDAGEADRLQLALVAVVLAGPAEVTAPVPMMVTVPGVGEDAAA